MINEKIPHIVLDPLMKKVLIKELELRAIKTLHSSKNSHLQFSNGREEHRIKIKTLQKISPKSIKNKAKNLALDTLIRFRITACQNGFLSILFFPPPQIEGDGKHSIDALIRIKKLALDSAKKNKYLKQKGLSPHTIPGPGEVVYLYSPNDALGHTQPIEVTPIASDFFKTLMFTLLKKSEFPYMTMDLWTEDITQESAPYAVGTPIPSLDFALHQNCGEPLFEQLINAFISFLFPEIEISEYGRYKRVPILHNTLNTFPKLARHFEKKLPQSWWFKPVAVEIEMNTICNLRCTGCAIIEDIEKANKGFNPEEIL